MNEPQRKQVRKQQKLEATKAELERKLRFVNYELKKIKELKDELEQRM